MGFWGIEVKPNNPYPYHADNVQGKLHITQATLGLGSSTEKSILQCSIGHKKPVFLCSLLPDKIESCPLNLEFDVDDLVSFSVLGSRSIHISGFFVADDEDDLRDDYEYDSFGEDIAETETEGSSDYDSEDEYGDDMLDDSDIDMYPPSPVPNSGVRIEEIVDDEDPALGDDQSKQLKKKNQEKAGKNSQNQIVVRGDAGGPVLESEDEDGFPISVSGKSKSDSLKAEAEVEGKHTHKRTEKTKKKKAKDGDHAASSKRKVEGVEQDELLEGKKKKKKKKLAEHGNEESAHVSSNDNVTGAAAEDKKHPHELKTAPLNGVSQAEHVHQEELSNEKVVVEKKKKKQKKKKSQENKGVTDVNSADKTTGNQNISVSDRGEKQTEDKPSQMRTFPNGLVIEELFMGKPDGKKAAPGKKVSVKYIGKLKKDGKIFDSNVGRAPFKFRLGIGQVIKGWDVGVSGMRVGDKRRITIPPSMGYGQKGMGPIPPNSWLVFDVELVDVN
ncbi:hypothetical protein L6164_006195 [Bauhinia variegata]|uniref:Uncharacterized protein n=1 Tax=Bauhinia variegata TaxID=167791 RepID=A0ACB9PTS8_BAUVA|nr:hypothetical protein L6164_006195 [Bauhinia variegata]